MTGNPIAPHPPRDRRECQHAEVYWYAAPLEDGWRCTCGFRPGEPPGYDPQRDRDNIHGKVWAILDGLHNADIVYVSNGCAGDSITADVAAKCKRHKVYDQYSIVAFILRAMTTRHAEYWKQVGDGIRAGKDPRDRCHCGALSTVTTWIDGKTERRCSEHAREIW
jgi:hypothetical protein